MLKVLYPITQSPCMIVSIAYYRSSNMRLLLIQKMVIYFFAGMNPRLFKIFVSKVFIRLNQILPSIFKDLVGMDSPVNKLLSYLDTRFPDVHMIGIWGIRGIRKPKQLAQVVSKRYKLSWKGTVFLHMLER